MSGYMYICVYIYSDPKVNGDGGLMVGVETNTSNYLSCEWHGECDIVDILSATGVP